MKSHLESVVEFLWHSIQIFKLEFGLQCCSDVALVNLCCPLQRQIAVTVQVLMQRKMISKLISCPTKGIAGAKVDHI